MSADADLLKRLDEMSARLRELEDREAIRNLIASYGPAVDRGAYEADFLFGNGFE